MRDHQVAVVEDVMADQSVQEPRDTLPELRRLPLELLQGIRQPVRDLYVPSLQFAYELDVVIARYTQRVTRGHHAHHELQHTGDVGPPVHQVADEDRFAALRRSRAERAVLALQRVAEVAQQ